MAKTISIAPALSWRWNAFSNLWLPALRAHAPLYLLVALHFAGATVLVAETPGIGHFPLEPFLLEVAIFLGAVTPLSIVTWRFFHLATTVRPKHPIMALLRDCRAFVRDPARMANGIAVLVAFLLFMNLFTYLKGAIPSVQPFAWDATFMEWDRWLHFGHDPWRLLQSMLGYPPVTFLITVIYHLWFMVMWIMVMGLAFAPVPSELRTRFFLAFMLNWMVGGNVLAMMFSSAGPCYYSLIGLSPDPYAPLMAYLHGVNEVLPVWALDTQLLLWQGYQGDGINLGISAMPSMHNGAALLFALAGWRINRKLGALLFGFTAMIFLGSVHLGWHYAIDGYSGLALALCAWWISGIAARRWEASPWAREYALAARSVAQETGSCVSET